MRTKINALALLLCLGFVLPATAQLPPPSKVITAIVMPPGPVAVGQTVTVTARMSSYSGQPADGFGFLVNYDPGILSFVSNSFNLGAASGPDQQWLTKPDQETAAEGYQPQWYCDGTTPGTVLASLGDVGRHYPPRGSVAPAGFLVSFQLTAIAPGTSGIMPTNYGGTALYDTSHQAISGAEFRGASLVVRDTDIIPGVTITSPAEGMVFHAPNKIGLTATAAVTNGSIAKVEFYADDLPKLGEATNAPYTMNWFYPTAGQHSLLAIATDNFGGTAASAPVQIVVNSLPTVSIGSPANDASFTAPGTIAIQASASDPDGAVVRVEFFAGNTLLGADTNAPFASMWTNVPAGSYALTARAVDDRGGATVSAPVAVTVRPNTGPPQILAAGSSLVSESGPANGGIDPGENMTIEFRLRNTGGSDTVNLVATLQSATGVVTPSGPQVYGVVPAGGSSVGKPFSFAAYGSAGGAVTATLELQDGTNNLGTVNYSFVLGGGTAMANTNAVTIRDGQSAGTYPSSIVVSGMTGLVATVSLTLSNLAHEFPSDIDALLVGPGGQNVLFMSDAGGGLAITNVTLCFDDGATNSLPKTNSISSGTYRPTDYPPDDTLAAPAPAGPYGKALSGFKGSAPNGSWSLYLMDDTAGDAGLLRGGWSLTLTTFDPVDPVADLGVSVTSAPGPVAVGSQVTFTTTITNAGPEEAPGVWATNLLPAGMTPISATSSQGSCSNLDGRVLCNLGTLAAGAAANMTVVAATSVVGSHNFVASTASAGQDFSGGNNCRTNVVTVSGIADVSVVVQATPVPVFLNNALTYTLLVSNAGPYAASGVTVTNTLPGGAAFVSASASQGTWAQAGGVLTASLGALESGGQATVTIACTSPSNACQLTNDACASASSPLDPRPANNAARLVTPNVPSAFVIVPAASLLVAEASPATGGIEAGETVSVCFYLKNLGSANTTNLTATLLASGGVISPGGTMNYGSVTRYGPAVGRTNSFTAVTNASGYLTATLQLQEGTLNLGTVDFCFSLGRRMTFTGSGAINIQDGTAANPYPSTNEVSGLSGVLTKVTATLSNLSHGYVSDVDVLLVAPDAQNVLLMSEAGLGTFVTNLTLTFDDAATNSLPWIGDLSSGRYRPANHYPGWSLPSPAPTWPYSGNLSVFNGANPNGTWRLYVADHWSGDGGSIGGWSLELTTTGEINPPSPYWEFLLPSPNGPARFSLHGRPGDTWQIDASTNLVNWTAVLTNTMATNILLFTDPAASNFNSRFYRAVWRP